MFHRLQCNEQFPFQTWLWFSRLCKNAKTLSQSRYKEEDLISRKNLPKANSLADCQLRMELETSVSPLFFHLRSEIFRVEVFRVSLSFWIMMSRIEIGYHSASATFGNCEAMEFNIFTCKVGDTDWKYRWDSHHFQDKCFHVWQAVSQIGSIKTFEWLLVLILCKKYFT
jgi:hypothetical protein